MSVPALSLCMIVKNEAHTLPRCLNSVARLAPEIVVVDTGSSDATRAVARRYRAKIHAFDFSYTDFAAARNCSLQLATGRWILVLDADETLHPDSIPLVQQLILRRENAGYHVTRVNHSRDSETAATDYPVRLFPNRKGYRFRGRVHETIDDSICARGGKLLRSEIRIDHEFAPDLEERRRKNRWYIRILNEEIAADASDCSRLEFLAAEYHQLGMFNKAAEIAERLASVRPLDATAHLHAGIYHLLFTGEPKRAREDFLEALRLRPDWPPARSFLNRIDREYGRSASTAQAASGT